ncbi:MAG TPA: bifunctional RNase H/acid phosphatase [Mycobacteriales bacterium]|nr:bifunctional RNase H/acid phosphatase [Mycobacteriales bacterium]
MRVVIEADGGSRGNPGPAGYGAVVRDADTGDVLREVADGIGVASNNVAEYRGLIAGLGIAVELGAAEVDVRMDSKLVVEQMSGRWKVKHPDMQALARQAAELLRQLPDVRFHHVPREQNAHADRLANEAMDAAAAGRSWQPSVEVPAPEPESAAAPAKSGNTLYGWSAPVEPRTVALLLRHGETSLSADLRFSGHGDAALTPRGEAQAAAAAKRIAEVGADVIVSSPLRRTRQTADAVATVLGLDVAVDEGFAESDFGRWEGLTFAEVSERWPDEIKAWLADPTVPPPGGESMAATAQRVLAARARVLEKYAGATVVVVSHVTPIKALLRDALDAPVQAMYRLHLDPASLSMVDWRAKEPSVVRLMNDTSYLGELVTKPPR